MDDKMSADYGFDMQQLRKVRDVLNHMPGGASTALPVPSEVRSLDDLLSWLRTYRGIAQHAFDRAEVAETEVERLTRQRETIREYLGTGTGFPGYRDPEDRGDLMRD